MYLGHWTNCRLA